MVREVHGSCHCGAVKITVTRPPADVTECHCTICRRYAGLWAYYPVKDVSLTGPTEVYIWGRKYLEYHRCSNCGCVMTWLPRGEYPECGVNVRMLDFDINSVKLIVEEDASV